MPVPFRDATEIEELGHAAFLRLVPENEGTGWLGALFTINARGEPIEFTYNRIETPHTFLWRADDVRQSAARRLTVSLLTLCPEPPKIIFCLAQEVGSELFGRDIQVTVPVCRVASTMTSVSYWDAEVRDALNGADSLSLFWTPDKPAVDSPERDLLNQLGMRGLVVEPFDRALVGLREVYKIPTPEDD